MSKQPEALRLAHNLDSEDVDLSNLPDAAAELRRLHALNAELVEALRGWLPERMPFPDQRRDPICEARNQQWERDRAALKKATEAA